MANYGILAERGGEMTHSPASPIPTVRPNPFDPPAELSGYRESSPLRRLLYPGGHVGWLVTSHSLARSILSDQRFSARSELKRSPISRPSIEPFFGAPALPGWLVDMDAPQHTRIRRQLAAHFTAQRIRKLQPEIEKIVSSQISELAEAPHPVDLVKAFAQPIPALTICELLGVRPSERGEVQRYSSSLFSLTASAAEASHAMEQLYSIIREMGQRRDQTYGLLGALAGAGILSAEEIAGLGVLLLTAGHESTTGSISLSIFVLLSRPEQMAIFTAEPALTDNAVEELLRYLSIFQFGVPRTPLVDVRLAGEDVKAGEAMTISLPAGNRDPSWFAEPDQLDLRRRTAGHLAFGYGIHQCLGQNLVRTEMKVALPRLLAAYPSLRLAVEPHEVPLAADMSVYGVHRLPVTW